MQGMCGCMSVCFLLFFLFFFSVCVCNIMAKIFFFVLIYISGTCPSLALTHGTFTFQYNTSQELTVGTRVTMQCEEGYSPINGIPSSTCGPSEQWQPAAPGCYGMTLYTYVNDCVVDPIVCTCVSLHSGKMCWVHIHHITRGQKESKDKFILIY